MAKFTSTADLNIWWRGIWQFVGPAGTEFSLPDSLQDEFDGENAGLIPGLTWTETVSNVTLPVAQSDVDGLTDALAGKAAAIHSHAESSVTNLTSDLAGKAALVHTHAESSVTNLATDLAAKLDKATGGTISGAVAFTASSTGGHLLINGGSFSNAYDTDLWIAGSQRVDPTNLSQGIYVQHRVSGNMNSHVQDAVASELRLSSISGATFLNAFEASIVVSSGTNTIPDTRAITANVTINSGVSGSVTAVRVIDAQAVVNSGTATIGTIYGLYVENQTVGSTNYNIYAPTGTSHFGYAETESDLTIGGGTGSRFLIINGAAGQQRGVAIQTNGSSRWIILANATGESGSNAGSDLQILARSDAGGANVTPLTITRSTGGIGIGNVPIGFFGTTPQSKQTVTGSRGGNAALASLLTALATYGIITNSTS